MGIDALGNILVAGGTPNAQNAAATDAVMARLTSGSIGVQVTAIAPSGLTAGLVAADGTTATTSYSEGDGTTLNGSFTAAGTQDTVTLSINWGDGSPTDTITLGPGQTTFSVPANEYAASGTYQVYATASDAGASSATFGPIPVTYTNVGPSELVLDLSDSAIETGDETTLSGSFDDPGTQNGCTVAIDWNSVGRRGPTRRA